METVETHRPAAVVLAEIATLLDGLEHDRRLAKDTDPLATMALALQIRDRLQTVTALLAADLAANQISDRTAGTPLVSWLADTQFMTRRVAHQLVGQGRDLARFDRLAHAALHGRTSFGQATVIAGILSQLSPEFEAGQMVEAETMMIGYAEQFDPIGLARLSQHLVEVLDPAGAEDRLGRKVEQDLKRAKANRGLTFHNDGHGSVLIRGQIPTLDAEPLIKLVDAYAQQTRATEPSPNRTEPAPTPAMRRADGLCALITAHQNSQLAPNLAGDRPRIVVTINYQNLYRDCTAAGLLNHNTPITAAQLRQLEPPQV